MNILCFNRLKKHLNWLGYLCCLEIKKMRFHIYYYLLYFYLKHLLINILSRYFVIVHNNYLAIHFTNTTHVQIAYETYNVKNSSFNNNNNHRTNRLQQTALGLKHARQRIVQMFTAALDVLAVVFCSLVVKFIRCVDIYYGKDYYVTQHEMQIFLKLLGCLFFQFNSIYFKVVILNSQLEWT